MELGGVFLFKNILILAENQYFDLDCYRTKLNNNVLVVGTSGSGKTRNIVTPNLLQATGSYILSDPKGNLYRKYKDYLQKKGYKVTKVDFIHPEQSIGYNPFTYIRSEQDIVKIAKLLADISGKDEKQPFWDFATELLFSAIIAYLWEEAKPEEQNLTNLQKILLACQIEEDNDKPNAVDQLMEELRERNPNSFAVRQYRKFRISATRTLKSILISAHAKTGIFDTKEMQKMLRFDEVNFSRIGQEKTAVFVIVSDTDRSMDGIANVFFSQAMNELCKYADENCDDRDNRLPVDVRFILDDFATHVKICEFPRMIASIRSRGISTMLMIQSEGQLRNAYGEDAKTIIGNCDSYVYLGGNDIETAQAVARRCDMPLKKVLNMPVGKCWIFRRGQEPVNATLFEIEKHKKEIERGINNEQVELDTLC